MRENTVKGTVITFLVMLVMMSLSLVIVYIFVPTPGGLILALVPQVLLITILLFSLGMSLNYSSFKIKKIYPKLVRLTGLAFAGIIYFCLFLYPILSGERHSVGRTARFLFIFLGLSLVLNIVVYFTGSRKTHSG